MNSLTSKQIRELLHEFSPKADGYVLGLTRAKFEELVEDTLDIDVSENPESNGRRLKALLKSCTDEQIDALLTALRSL